MTYAPSAEVRLLIQRRDQPRDAKGRFDFSTGGGENSASGGGHVRDSLRGASSHEDLRQAASAEFKRITGRDIPVDMTGADLQESKEYLEGVAQGLERFPGAGLVGVHTYGKGSGPDPTGNKANLAKAQPEAFAVTSSFGTVENGKFAMHSNIYFNNSPGVADFGEVRDGYVVAPTRVGVGLHEMGHVVAQRAGKRDAYDKAVEMADQAGAGPRFYITKNVSEYASTDMSEFAAEVFADVMHNGDNASSVSKAAFDVLEAGYQAAG